jgi:hypothetical protein
MMHELARRRAHLWGTINAITVASSDGSPKAQRKLQQRIEQTGEVLLTQLRAARRLHRGRRRGS